MKKRVIIIFDNYPFEPGEYSFVRTELEKLLAYFEVDILSLSPSVEQKMAVDERISVYHCSRKFGWREKLRAAVRFFFSRYGFIECNRIIKGGQDIWGRLYDAIVYFGEADQLRSYVKKNGMLRGDELIYSYWFNANCLAFLLEKKRYPKLKVVSRIHGYDLYNERCVHGRQPFREAMDEAADRIFFVAQAGLQYYLEHWGKRENIGRKYIVAPIGTVCGTLPQAASVDSDENSFHIVSCSHVIPLKRVELLVEGLAQIRDRKIRWIHFGTGDRYEETKRYAEELFAEKDNLCYEMPGYVPVEEILKYYADHRVDCFMTVSATEGSPVSVQEAMAYGIPVIGTAVGEIPNMIEGNGILLSEDPRPEEIREAVASLYHASEEEILQMRKRSREIWEERYNAEENGKKFVELLREID